MDINPVECNIRGREVLRMACVVGLNNILIATLMCLFTLIMMTNGIIVLAEWLVEIVRT